MSFDQTTRTRLARFVSDARSLLADEFTRQLQNDYGLDPQTGDVTDLARLDHLDDARRETARLLRDTMEHYLAAADTGTPAKAKKSRQDVLDRIVREQAFTILNRLCALRMSEARGLLIESIAKGYHSKGFQLYQRLAGTALGETGACYRQFIFSVFDEFAVDLPVLFDRFSPQGRLFPREAALLSVLQEINHPDIDPLWAEDETIGWIYQYFNDPNERKAMRDPKQGGSAAPRNSREMAVRNQFFTPRYVVEFLTDNTLGRIWYEMTKGESSLKDSCRYLVRRPNEIFLSEGEVVPEQEDTGEELSQEELLKQIVHILHRPLKDPRDIKMLDPACGSMHFGLYAFDLFERIYEEAWEIEVQRGADGFIRTEELKPLHESYTDKGAFLRDVPRLIIEHNIHGIDIDPRAVQISGVSLWLRAQRYWQAQNVKVLDRPQIQRSNIVCAEPMPGEAEMLEEFTEQLQPKVLGQLVKIIFEKMKLAGEAGSLLKIEVEIKDAVSTAHAAYRKYLLEQQKDSEYLPGMAPKREATLFDFAGLPEEDEFWNSVEVRVISVLRNYSEQAESWAYQRRLFANDAAQGFAFIDLCRKRYDVLLMNPPFGEGSRELRSRLDKLGHHNRDLASDFVANGLLMLCQDGLLGAITTRTIFFLKGFLEWRDQIVRCTGGPICFLDIGFGVLDAAVEASAFTLSSTKRHSKGVYFSALGDHEKLEAGGSNQLNKSPRYLVLASDFSAIPRHPFAYWCSERLLELFRDSPRIENYFDVLSGGNPRDDFRFVRHWVECPHAQETTFVPYSKGGEFAMYYYDVHLMLQWRDGGRELKAQASEYRRSLGWSPDWRALMMNYDRYFSPGITWPRRTSRLSFRFLPAGCVFGDKSPMVQSIIGSTNSLVSLLGLLNSSAFGEAVKLMVGSSVLAQSFEVGIIKSCPFPNIEVQIESKLVLEIYRALIQLDSISETSHAFILLPIKKDSSVEGSWRLLQSVQSDIFDIVIDNHSKIEKEASLSLGVISQGSSLLIQDFAEIDKIDFVAGHLSSVLGSVFGRWDIRYATGERQPPKLPEPLDPLPLYPPGMLQNAQELPAEPRDVPGNYPLRISWPGILVDDENNAEDIVVRIREAIDIIWKESAENVEQEACEILGVQDLRDYFQRSAYFFADHLMRYSKSRRQAPIYWPLSLPSGSYTIWLYYHRITDQTIYTCVNDFVDPKFKQASDDATILRNKSNRSSAEEKQLERLSELELELKDFRDELLRIARFWKPNLNDGVQITAAPLWNLFQHRQWKARLKETWEKLEAGEYDWAHTALFIWPDRVVRASHKDRSYAIAHDLDDQLWHEVEVEKVGRGGRVTTTIEWRPRDLSSADLQRIIAEVKAR